MSNFLSGIRPAIYMGMSTGIAVASYTHRVSRKNVRVAITLGAGAAVVTFLTLVVIRSLIKLVKSAISSKASEKPLLTCTPVKRLSLELAEAQQTMAVQYESCLATFNGTGVPVQKKEEALGEMGKLLGTFVPSETDHRALNIFNDRIVSHCEQLKKTAANSETIRMQMQLYIAILSATGNKYYDYAQQMENGQKEERARQLYAVAAHWLHITAKNSNEPAVMLHFSRCVVRGCHLRKEHREILEKSLITAGSGNWSNWKKNFGLVLGIWHLHCYEESAMKPKDDTTLNKAIQNSNEARKYLSEADQTDEITQALIERLPILTKVKERTE